MKWRRVRVTIWDINRMDVGGDVEAARCKFGDGRVAGRHFVRALLVVVFVSLRVLSTVVRRQRLGSGFSVAGFV